MGKAFQTPTPPAPLSTVARCVAEYQEAAAVYLKSLELGHFDPTARERYASAKLALESTRAALAGTASESASESAEGG